jgi:hypothetical protein
MSTDDGFILFDVASDPGAAFETSFLERNGHPVVVCHGPSPGTRCPILSGARCELVDQAAGIVFALDLERPQHRAILERYREVVPPDTPIFVLARGGDTSGLRADFQVWTHAPTAADLDGLAAEVEAAERA